MIPSVIATSHFYYLSFFTSKVINGVESIFRYFPDDNEHEVLTNQTHFKSYHLQAEIEKIYGSESLLILNKSERSTTKSRYWYDFYVGELNGAQRVFFICFPYIKLSSYVDDLLVDAQTRRLYLKPSVDRVLEYLNHNPSTEYRETKDNKVFRAEISKYSATVTDDSANRIYIFGKDPLKSHVYELLKNDENIGIEPQSLKLECKYDGNQLDLSFDQYGNMRFYLNRTNKEGLTAMINNIYQYFERAKVLSESSFISKRTVLEENE